ncbi:hypothetical protein F5B21DRAFT_509969 [Xylaria acuta]|nr:hypothetical protein F5B21DRAFT_509969 [Xylaria acuta]
MKALSPIVLLGVWALSVMARPIIVLTRKETEKSGFQPVERDGQGSEFDADLMILKERDGQGSEFDADLMILKGRDGQGSEFDADLMILKRK